MIDKHIYSEGWNFSIYGEVIIKVSFVDFDLLEWFVWLVKWHDIHFLFFGAIYTSLQTFHVLLDAVPEKPP